MSSFLTSLKLNSNIGLSLEKQDQIKFEKWQPFSKIFVYTAFQVYKPHGFANTEAKVTHFLDRICFDVKKQTLYL